jgi:uncharacterized protein YjiS (DUF1127 family)
MPELTPLIPRRLAPRRLLNRLAAIDAGLRRRADLGRIDERTLRDIGVTRAVIDAELGRLSRLGL